MKIKTDSPFIYRRSWKNLDWNICLIIQLCRETSIHFLGSTPLTSLMSRSSPVCDTFFFLH